MSPEGTTDSRGGSLYLSTRTDGILSGEWCVGATPPESGPVLLLGNQAPTSSANGRNYFCRASNGENLPAGWKQVKDYRPGIDPGDADGWLVDVSRYSVLDWMADLPRPSDQAILDLRSTDKSLMYHLLPVRGWVQENGSPPVNHHPIKIPEVSDGEGPVFVLVHGFTGDPINWFPVADRLSEGPWPYVLPLLPGHGQPRHRFANCGWEEWVKSVGQLALELRDQGRQLIGLGLSMGGSVLLKNHQLFDAMVTVNTPWTLHDWRAPLLPVLKYFMRNHFSPKGGKVIPVSAINELRKLQAQVRKIVKDVEIPVLVLNNKGDDVIPMADGERLESALRFSQRVVLSRGGHESPGQSETLPELMTAIQDFFDRQQIDVPYLSQLT